VSTGGTLGRNDYMPGKDAMVVARACAAGAIHLLMRL
jgi:amidase